MSRYKDSNFKGYIGGEKDFKWKRHELSTCVTMLCFFSQSVDLHVHFWKKRFSAWHRVHTWFRWYRFGIWQVTHWWFRRPFICRTAFRMRIMINCTVIDIMMRRWSVFLSWLVPNELSPFPFMASETTHMWIGVVVVVVVDWSWPRHIALSSSRRIQIRSNLHRREWVMDDGVIECEFARKYPCFSNQ